MLEHQVRAEASVAILTSQFRREQIAFYCFLVPLQEHEPSCGIYPPFRSRKSRHGCIHSKCPSVNKIWDFNCLRRPPRRRSVQIALSFCLTTPPNCWRYHAKDLGQTLRPKPAYWCTQCYALDIAAVGKLEDTRKNFISRRIFLYFDPPPFCASLVGRWLKVNDEF